MSEREPLRNRFVAYALRVLRLYRAMPKRHEGGVIGNQLLRSGLSVGAHFREGVRARSSAEFISKMNAGLMELEETMYWLEIVEASRLFPRRHLESLTDESNQLAAILVSLIKKAARSRK